MRIKYAVTVKEDYRWSTANVGGRPFSKLGETELTVDDMTDEILNSPILAVVEVEEPEAAAEIDATDAARLMAEENGVALADVDGTGEDGRIVVKDVELFIRARDGGGDNDPDSAD